MNTASSRFGRCAPRAWIYGGIFMHWDSYLDCEKKSYERVWTASFSIPTPFFRGGGTRRVTRTFRQQGWKLKYTHQHQLFHHPSCRFEPSMDSCICRCSEATRECARMYENSFGDSLARPLLCESSFSSEISEAFTDKTNELVGEGTRMENSANSTQQVVPYSEINRSDIINQVRSQYPVIIGPISVSHGQWTEKSGSSRCERIQLSQPNANENIDFLRKEETGFGVNDGPPLCSAGGSRSVGSSNLFLI